VAIANITYKLPEPTEADNKKAIIRFLNDNGIKNFPYSQFGYGNKSGVSDRLGWFPKRIDPKRAGKFIAIEIKRGGWVPPKSTNKKEYAHYLDQKKFIDEVNIDGGIAFFATSVDDVVDGLGIRHLFLF
jgi:hypothetical protein